MISEICRRPSNLSKTALDYPKVSQKRPKNTKKSRGSVDAYLFCKQWGTGFRGID